MTNPTDPEVLRAHVRDALGEPGLSDTDRLVRVLAAIAGPLDRIADSLEDIRAMFDADRRERGPRCD